MSETMRRTSPVLDIAADRNNYAATLTSLRQLSEEGVAGWRSRNKNESWVSGYAIYRSPNGAAVKRHVQSQGLMPHSAQIKGIGLLFLDKQNKYQIHTGLL